ncbi:MAG: DUF4132 domain-containing protein [Clostridiales bacterium]|nr:DUF4132 domain-containing protein [Clostridiales bacterium]
MVTDKRILKAIASVDDPVVKSILEREDYDVGHDVDLDFIFKHEKAYRKLIPDYFDTMVEAIERNQMLGWHFRTVLTSYLCLQTGTVDPTDLNSVKNFEAAGIDITALSNRSLMKGCIDGKIFKTGLDKKKFTAQNVIDFINKNPLYTSFFSQLLVTYDDTTLWQNSVEHVINAKNEDGLRISELRAMLTTTNPRALAYYCDEIDRLDIYRFKAFNEVAVMMGDYTVVLTPKELVEVLRDAATAAVDKYISAGFKRAHTFTEALIRLYPDKVKDFVARSLELGSPRTRLGVLHALPQYFISENAEVIFGGKIGISIEELSVFTWRIKVDRTPEKNLPIMFDGLLAVLEQMDKVNYYFKTDDEISFAHELSKSSVVEDLAEIAVKLNSRNRALVLDKMYDSFKDEAQATYLGKIGNLTSLDRRACTICLLKTDGYNASKQYDAEKITLTYDEAVKVSDYLKSKKQSVKTKIIKEFIKSKDSDKIADYLIGCKEDYKVAAGEEIRKSSDKVSCEKLDKTTSRYYWEAESVFKNEKPQAEIDKLAALKIKSYKPCVPNAKKLQSLADKLTELLKTNADYEYKPKYGDALVTLGAEFRLMDNGEPALTFGAYPFGNEIHDIILSVFSGNELADLLVFLFAQKCGNKLCSALYGDGRDAKGALAVFEKFDKKYFSVNAYTILRDLFSAAVREFLNEDTSIAAALRFTEKEVLPLLKDDTPYEFLRALGRFGDNALNALAHILCVWNKNDCDSTWFEIDITAKVYEAGYFSDALMKYFILEYDSYLGILYEPEAEICVLRDDGKYPKFKAFINRFVDEGLQTEFARGSLETPYDSVLRRIRRIYGVDNYMHAIAALRGLTWVRSPYGTSKDDMLSAILKRIVKTSGESYEQYESSVKKYGITDDELIKATLFNPEYADYAAKYLNIKNLKLAVYWFVAHLNETVENERQERRVEQIKQFSDINYLDFKDGAFDSKWYAEMKSSVDEKTLKRIYDNAKYVTVGGLHKRAQRFFDAVSGKITKKECLDKISTTRNKDYCLIYSLIPIENRADLIERYEVLSEFLRASKQFGAQRQASERRTVDIAFENLARVAGYADTDVFVFEMESENPSDIYKPYDFDGVTVTPYIDENKFKVGYRVEKDGKTLSSVPAKQAKNKELAALRDQIKQLNKKFRRIITGLENAMNTLSEFTVDRLVSMSREPLIKTALGKLVFMADGRAAVFDGSKLTDFDGKKISADKCYIAHAVTLKENALLDKAIAHIVKNNIKQPFKQVLREIYIKSPEEKTQDEVLRFRGFNVDLKRCVAALKSKGWSVSEDIGLRKVYYKTDTVAAIFREFDIFYTVDFENLNRELHGIYFLNRRDCEIIPLEKVDSITFSETLRDVDLMITVSSNTVYDFELAKSTVEIRKAVLTSIVDILSLKNVTFLKDNIRVEGHYGTYVVNIRTGLVFKEGKGNLLLDTVYSVDKPLLLDFVDEDPMTADIISKAIVLSADEKIRDAAILREIKD